LQPLSKSTYQTFESCPWKAHCHKNLGIKSESGPAAEMGIKVHELIAKILTGEIKYDDIDIFAETEEMATLTKALSRFPFPEEVLSGIC
jgi:hypothetical protein